MKVLTLKDGSTFQMEDGSNVSVFRIPVQNYSAVDDLCAAFTEENLSDISIGVVQHIGVINERVYVEMDDNGTIIAVFVNRMGMDEMVQDAIDLYTLDLIEGGVI